MKFTITDLEAGSRLDKLLVQLVPGLGRAAAKRLFDEGRVRVVAPERTGRGRVASKGDVAAAGEVIELDLEPDDASGAAIPEPDAPLQVILERHDLVIVDKPAGMPTAPLKPGERGTLANALVGHYPEMANIGFSSREPGLCHRLDTETSGLVLAARTAKAFAALVNALKEARLDKRYLLICQSGDLPEIGAIEIPLAPHPKDRRRVYPCIHPRDVIRYEPRPATTTYRRVALAGLWELVEARAPKAMRHQIRAHFAAIGHPLAGDTLYGGPAAPGLERHALHAEYIAWAGSAEVPAFTARSPLPPDMQAIVGTPDMASDSTAEAAALDDELDDDVDEEDEDDVDEGDEDDDEPSDGADDTGAR
ncbi:RluA family pseudouridine synthase [Chondromyces crocatus]|uniref:Pseudouridine synthase n=1 Tax=Chondromyces crocatus TaxID=52 RepID=A0A0K1EP10_CHOCO|nr:RluA family pseudouridine synthase [Chondromyces crocatus]AKT42645.1 pseudouridine synthase [Chondromyces crocatus]